MANKTRGQIRLRVFDYFPQISSKVDRVNDLMDFIVEEMSNRHDFRCLRAPTFDTANLAAGSYTLPLSSFPVLGAAGSGFKDILQMRWLIPGTQYYGKIKFIDDSEWHEKYQYVDYANNPRSKPIEYTRMGDVLYFNTQVDEQIKIRVFWQKYHLDFATIAAGMVGTVDPDNVPHQFQSKDNSLAFQTIVYGVLKESKSMISGVEAPQDVQMAETLYEKYLQQLIARDRDVANESLSIGWGEKSQSPVIQDDPYGWART